MGTRYAEICRRLAAPIPRERVKTFAKGGKQLSYITGRTVQNRLDEVIGPENWSDEFVETREGLRCRITIRFPDGTTAYKEDGGGAAGMQDHDDDEKSAYSSAFKRAAVKWGIGRELYRDGVADFGQEGPAETPRKAPQSPQDERTRTQRLLDWAHREGHDDRLRALARSRYELHPDELNEDQALDLYKLLSAATVQSPTRPDGTPSPGRETGTIDGPAPGKNGNGNPINFGWPSTGKALFAWSKKIEEAFHTDVIRSLKEGFCGKQRGQDAWDTNIIQWNLEQVQEAAVYVAKFVREFPGYDGQFDSHIPDLKALRDRVWAAGAEIVAGFGGEPTAEAVVKQIASSSHNFAARLGGEVINHPDECEDAAYLGKLAELMEEDARDAQTTF